MSMNNTFAFTSPLLKRRIRERDNSTSISAIISKGSSSASIFGKTRQQLKAIMEPITAIAPGGKKNSFLTDTEVTKALKSRRNLTAWLDMDNLDQGYKYEALGEKVWEFLFSVEQKNIIESSEIPSPEEKILQTALESKIVENKDEQRVQLLDFLLALAQISSLLGIDDSSHRKFTKQFVLFLIDNILLIEKTEDKFKKLLTAMELAVPGDADAWNFKTKAAQSIFGKIIGDDSMESVVELSVGLAQATFRKTNKNNPKILVKSMHDFAKNHWATDDFAGSDKALLDTEVLELTDGQLTPYSSLCEDEIVDTTTNNVELSVAETSDTGTLDDSRTQSQMINQLHGIIRDLASVAKRALDMHQKEKLMSPSEIRDSFLSIEALEKVLPAGGKWSVVATESTTPLTFVGNTRRGEMVSPLTIPATESFAFDEMNNGFGSAENGLSITSKGLICCYQQLQNREDCPNPLRDYLKMKLPDEWKTPIDTPTNAVEQALAGCKYTENDFELLGVLGGGSFGRVFKARLKSKPAVRSAIKVVYFNVENLLLYGAREVIDGTKVKSPHIIRTLGYFPIVSIKINNSPLAMGIILEECVENLKPTINKLNTGKVALRDKVRKSCDIILQILSGVNDLHSFGVTHRDIKPGNVCLAKDGYYKLIDLGLAREIDENGMLTENAGTGPYIPPGGCGKKHDEYSTAVVWHELLTGKTPAWMDSASKALTRSQVCLAFEIDSLNEGKDLIDLFMHLIEPDDTKRWTAEQALPALTTIFKSLST